MEKNIRIELINKLHNQLNSNEDLLDKRSKLLWIYGDEDVNEDTFEKQLNRIVNSDDIIYPSSYSKNRINSDNDEIVIYFDYSYVKNGRSGFAITTRYMYRLTDYARVPLSDIEKAAVYGESGMFYLTIRISDGTNWEFKDDSNRISTDKSSFECIRNVINTYLEVWPEYGSGEQYEVKKDENEIESNKSIKESSKICIKDLVGSDANKELERLQSEFEKSVRDAGLAIGMSEEEIENMLSGDDSVVQDGINTKNKYSLKENSQITETVIEDNEAKEQNENDIQEAQKLEQERLEVERQKKLEKERLEVERQKKLEEERLEAERQKKLEDERLEAERIKKEKYIEEWKEKTRLEGERIAYKKNISLEYFKSEGIIPADEIALNREVLFRVFNKFGSESNIICKYLYELEDSFLNGYFKNERNLGQYLIYCKPPIIVTDQRVYFCGNESFCYKLKDIIELVPMHNNTYTSFALLFGFTNRTIYIKPFDINNIVDDIYALNVGLGAIESLKGNKPLGYYYIPGRAGNNKTFVCCNNIKKMTTINNDNNAPFCSVCSKPISDGNHYQISYSSKLSEMSNGIREILVCGSQELIGCSYATDRKVRGVLKDYKTIEQKKNEKQNMYLIFRQLITGTVFQKYGIFSYMENINDPNLKNKFQYQLTHYPGQYVLYFDENIYLSDRFFGWDSLFKPLDELQEIQWNSYPQNAPDYKKHKDKSILVVLKNGEKYRLKDFGYQGRFLAETINAAILVPGAFERANQLKTYRKQ